MKYTVQIADALDHFVGIKAEIKTQAASVLRLQLPAWRPGRYELGNFAKNIRKLNFADDKGNALKFHKVSKDCWEVFCLNQDRIILSYEYYANQPDAGASFVGENLLYLNPVNCFMYVQNRESDA